MAFIAVGAAALGIAGLSAYVNPGKQEAEELALSMFGKPLKACTPNERKAVDMAAGFPKLVGLRDKFQSLFPRPKATQPKTRASQQPKKVGTVDAGDEAGDESSEYALYDDKDVLAVYPVHEDTADPDQRYLADFSDLKNLVPFDIETESIEDAGTYDVEEFLKNNDRLPQTLTLPRQLGGAATSANLLINKLTKGARAGISEGYVLPGHSPHDSVHPPTHEVLEGPPESAKRSLQDLVDYRLGAGAYESDIPHDVKRALAKRMVEQAEASQDEVESSSYEYYDDEDEDVEDEDEEDDAVLVQVTPSTQKHRQQQAAAAVRSGVDEYDDDDEDEYEDE